MELSGCVFVPRFLVFLAGLLVEQCRPTLGTTVALEPFLVVSDGQLRRLVLDEISVLQPRERPAYRASLDADLGRELARLERQILMDGEEPKHLIGEGEVFELVLARVLADLPVDGQP
jgi:hypothetical protein